MKRNVCTSLQILATTQTHRFPSPVRLVHLNNRSTKKKKQTNDEQQPKTVRKPSMLQWTGTTAESALGNIKKLLESGGVGHETEVSTRKFFALQTA